MNSLKIRHILMIMGIALICLAQAPASTTTVLSAPLAALTPSAEPPTPVPPTSIPPTSLPPSSIPPTSLPPTEVPTTGLPATSLPATEPPGQPDGADPAVIKTANLSTARIGDVIEFTLRVTNYGDETAKDVVVTDNMPGFLDVVDVQADKGTIAVSGQMVVVTIGNVEPGEIIDIHIRARVNERATPGAATNSATLTTSNDSDYPPNNVSNVTIIIETPLPSPTPLPTEVLPATFTPEPAAVVAPPAGPPSGRSRTPPPNRMPPTGEAVGEQITWLLTGLGLALIGLSLWLRRRSNTAPDRNLNKKF